VTAASVQIWRGVAGEEGERQVVWIVSVHDAADDEVHGYDWGVHDDEEDAEDAAVALAARIGVPIIDKRETPPSNVVPFRRPTK